MTSGQDQRLYYLDAVRALALLLGVVFHAGLSFMPMFIGWAVMDISTSYAVAVFVFISHAFRMPLFFLIAGYFTCMTLRRMNNKAFVVSRAVKLAIPLCVGWFVLRPLIVAGWVAGGQSMQGGIEIHATLTQALEVFTSLPSGFLIGTHLWFLYYLLLVTGTVLAIRTIMGLFPQQKVQLQRWVNCLFNAPKLKHKKQTAGRAQLIVSFMAKGAVCIVPTAICLWFMNSWGIDTPDQSLVVHWPAYLLYLGWFGIGYILFTNEHLFERFSHMTLAKGAWGVTALVTALVLTEYEMLQGHPDYVLLKGTFCLCYAIMMWTLVPATISVCRRLFSTRRAWVQYIAQASYWIYLVHLPVVVWLQIAVAELPVHWAVKWLAVCVATLAVALVTYSTIVKNTFVEKVLKGKVAY